MLLRLLTANPPPMRAMANTRLQLRRVDKAHSSSKRALQFDLFSLPSPCFAPIQMLSAERFCFELEFLEKRRLHKEIQIAIEPDIYICSITEATAVHNIIYIISVLCPC